MRRLSVMFTMLCAAAALLVTACEDAPVDNKVKEPVLKLTSDAEMEFAAEGGKGTITYTVENPKEGVTLTAECEAEWVTDITIGNNINFNVTANEGEARETKLVAKYDAQSFEVTLRQVAKGEEPVVKTPAITLDNSAVEARVEGGTYTIGYTVENPTEEATLAAECAAEWISDIVIGDNTLRFTVAANELYESREAIIDVTYPEAEAKQITVTQAAQEKPVIEGDFRIDVEEVTTTSCITKVTPADENMYYVMYFTTVDYLVESELLTEDALFEDDIYYFRRGADYEGVTLKQYMLNNQVLFQGVTRAQWTSVQVGVQSLLYVYGVEFNEDETECVKITPIAYEIIEPKNADLNDATFNVDVEVNGAKVKVHVEPEGWSGHYAVQIFDQYHPFYYDASQPIADDYVDALSAAWVELYTTNIESGISPEMILEAACLKGNDTWEQELMSEERYTVAVFAVDEVDGIYQMVSQPTVLNFETTAVQPSDMTIDIDVSNCYVRVCDLTITPSVDDETYLMLLVPTKYLNANYNDNDLLKAALDTYAAWTFTFRGKITSHVNTLIPDTEYIVVTFGYSGGVVTTPVFKNVFSTDPEGVCENSLTKVSYGGPYKPSEVEAVAPGRFNLMGYPDDYYFLMWSEVETAIPNTEIFTYFVDTWTFNGYGEETIFFDMLIAPCDPIDVATGQYGFDYYLCAAAFDYKGDVTPMYKSEVITWTLDDARPAEELINKLDSSPKAQLHIMKAVRK